MMAEHNNNLETSAIDQPLPTPGSPAPFNIEELRLSQDFHAEVDTRKILTVVPVGKPNPQAFFQTHPDETFRMATAVVELKEEREIYLIDRGLWTELPEEIVFKTIFTGITKQGDLFLWPIRLPNQGGHLDGWSKSAMSAAEIGMTQWIRLKSNQALGAYDVIAASAEFPNPVWPDITFTQIMEIAFKDRFIRDYDHPVLKNLRGAQ